MAAGRQREGKKGEDEVVVGGWGRGVEGECRWGVMGGGRGRGKGSGLLNVIPIKIMIALASKGKLEIIDFLSGSNSEAIQ